MFQKGRCCPHHHFRVLPGGENAFPHGQLHVHKGPASQNVLQGPVCCPLCGHFQKTAGFLLPCFPVSVEQQPLPVQPPHRLCQTGGVKFRAVTSGFFQPAGFLPVQLSDGHRTIRSSPFSGMTFSMAAMATSIMPSSGSLVVMRCTHRPGAAMIRVSRLSFFPQRRISS